MFVPLITLLNYHTLILNTVLNKISYDCSSFVSSIFELQLLLSKYEKVNMQTVIYLQWVNQLFYFSYSLTFKNEINNSMRDFIGNLQLRILINFVQTKYSLILNEGRCRIILLTVQFKNQSIISKLFLIFCNNYIKMHNKIMSSSSAQPDKSQQLEQKLLKTVNLIPMYIIEDNLQSNFKRINNFISETIQKHQILKQQSRKLAAEQAAMKNNFNNQLKIMENKIITEINMQLQGRIAIAVGKSIDSFTSKIQERQKNMGNMKDEFESKLKKLKEELKYQMSMDNQRYFNKQIKKVQQALKRNIQTQQIKITPKLENKNSSIDQHQDQQNTGKWQQQHHQITSLQSRIQSLQDFSINVDKRIYNGMTSLKESWKQLGEELLQNKKNLGKKMDELKIDFIKLKSLKEFSIAPDKIQDQFKKKLNQKFTEIYQLLSVSLTKNQYETTTQRLNRKINRHDDEFIEIRKQLATNNQFFTFYANNSNQDNLNKQLEEVFQAISLDRKKIQLNFNDFNNKVNLNNNSIVEMDKNLREVIQNLQNKIKQIDSMGQIVNGVKDRIENLEDFNRFGPDKLDKIHSSLDIDFTATQRQLIDNKTKKQNISNVEQSQRQLRIQLNKMKDELFLLSSQNQVKDDQIVQMRKNYKQLQSKLQKVKGQNQQAMASRKPWVCLSCDKQQRDKDQAKKQSKLKRPQPFKGFPQQRSQKMLKPPPTPPFQQRFEVYEKLRQKYLSDTIKLPDIFKQKLKDNKDTSFQN